MSSEEQLLRMIDQSIQCSRAISEQIVEGEEEKEARRASEYEMYYI